MNKKLAKSCKVDFLNNVFIEAMNTLKMYTSHTGHYCQEVIPFRISKQPPAAAKTSINVFSDLFCR